MLIDDKAGGDKARHFCYRRRQHFECAIHKILVAFRTGEQVQDGLPEEGEQGDFRQRF